MLAQTSRTIKKIILITLTDGSTSHAPLVDGSETEKNNLALRPVYPLI